MTLSDSVISPPVLECMTTDDIAEALSRLKGVRPLLRRMSISEIVDCLDRAMRLLSEEGHSPCLALLLSQLTRDRLWELLTSELRDPFILDDFQKDPVTQIRRSVRAEGVGCLTQILPGNVPDIILMSAILALLAKSPSLIKLSHGGAGMAWFVRFKQALEKICPVLSQACIGILWPSHRRDLTEAALAQSDGVVVYGDEETIHAIRPLIPAGVPALLYGHKISLGVVTSECISKKWAELAVVDVIAYAQRGCLSPHLYYVETGETLSALDFAVQMAEAFSALNVPPPEISLNEAARIQQLRGSLPLSGGVVFASKAHLSWTVLYDPDPTFQASPLGQTVWIKPVKNITDVPTYLEAVKPYLQAVGFAAPEHRQGEIARMLATTGICRICPVGTMQRPPLIWHHNGRFRLLDLLRLIDWEDRPHTN